MTNDEDKSGSGNGFDNVSSATNHEITDATLRSSPADGSKLSLVKRVASNGWFTIVAALASIISVPASIYFYLEAKESVELRYSVSVTRTTVVKANQISKLKASFNDVPLLQDVSAVQLSFSNLGKRSIKTANILKPVTVRIPNGKILDAIIASQSRDVVKANLIHQSEEVAEISWNIMEKDDSIGVQLIYMGSTDLPIKVSGVIEGQPEIAEDNSKDEYKSKLRRSLAFLLLLGALGGITFQSITFMLGTKKKFHTPLGLTFWVQIVFFVGSVIYSTILMSKIH